MSKYPAATRGAPETVTQREPLPLYLVRALNELGVEESESLALTAAEPRFHGGLTHMGYEPTIAPTA